MHEHNDCKHELKYCEICDVVYCEMCKKEWKHYNWTYTSPTYPKIEYVGYEVYPNITISDNSESTSHKHNTDNHST